MAFEAAGVESVRVTGKLSPTAVVGPIAEFVKEYSGTFATEFAVLISQILVYKLAARYLGQDGFAEYAVARRTVSVLYPLVLVGLAVGLPRYVAHAVGQGEPESRDRYLGAAIWCVGFTAVLCIGLMNLFAVHVARLFFGAKAYAEMIFPLSLVVAGLALHAIVYAYLRGTLLMGWANLLQFVNLGAVPPLVFLFFHKTVASVLAALGVLCLASSAIAFLFLPWKQATRDNASEAITLLRYGIQRVPGDFILMALLLLPTTVIAHSRGVTQAGFVAFGVSLLNAVGAFFSPIGLILLPRAGRLLASGEVGELRRQVLTLVKITLTCSTAIAVGGSLVADRLIRSYLGPGYEETGGIVRVLLFAAIPYSLYLVLRNVVDAFHEIGMTTLILTGGFVVCCASCLVLWPLQDKILTALIAFNAGALTLCLLAGGEVYRILRHPLSA